MSSSAACVDASFVARLFLGPDDEVFWKVLENWQEGGGSLHAPSLLCFELANVFHRCRRAGYLSQATSELVLDAALNLPIRIDTDTSLHLAALRTAAAYESAATYDAHYLALAARLGAELWTADAKLAQNAAARGVAARLVGRAPAEAGPC